MKINWKVRIKSKKFWVFIIFTVIPQIIQVLAPEYTEAYSEILNIITAVFAIIGITVDPTTRGISDSTTAMTYEEPK